MPPLFYRIIPARKQRIAFQNPSQTQQDTLPDTFFFDSFCHVTGTGWIVPAFSWDIR
jgi:hypothetical protein